MNEEIAFDDFLDSEVGDKIFAELQLEIQKAFVEGYKKGCENKEC